MYTFESAKAACGNVAGLLKWTIAMTKFFDVNKEVLPLKAKLSVQKMNYARAEAELQKAQHIFEAKENELNEVKKELQAAQDKKESALREAKHCEDKMSAANALIVGLADEQIRWTGQIAQFSEKISYLVGDVIFLTAFLSYAGPFNQEFRLLCQKIWYDEIVRLKIPISENISVVNDLADKTTIGEWNIKGLPNDELSIQNGIIVTKAARYPLLIDPQNQGKMWIINMEKSNNLVVTTLNHRFFRNHMEDAISLGTPILIEDINEDLDPALDSILEKNLIKIGTSYKIKFGDKEIDFNKNFRLYITTKLANPVYTPEISAKTSIIDFAVTMKGLEDQLLGRVILKEKNELEQESMQLITDVNTNQRRIMELEDNLVHKLSTTEGSLLEDKSVIDVLNSTKATSIEVNEKLEISKITEVKINTAREEYRPVANRGSVLYFLVCTMSMVNVMYQMSLLQFLERFDLSMDNSEKSHATQRRISNIIDYLNYEIFSYTTRGLFETHKFLFSLLMALNIDIKGGKITYEEFQNFIKGGAALNINECPPRPHSWITDMSWLNLVQLSTIPTFANVINHITTNEKSWRQWLRKNFPEEESFPMEYDKLNQFRKLLLIRSCCPDRIYAQSRKYIKWSMGERFASSVVLNYETLYNDSRQLTPLICFLSVGSDPTPNIQALAKKQEVQCYAISMGQGQEIHARKLINECMKDGGWTLLQNCHLGLDYMNELVNQIMELEKTEAHVHENFRIWITTEVHNNFPISLLQMSIKYTNEPPSGIRAGLKRTYANLNQDLLDYSQSPYYLPLIYAISFLHTIVQERRKYGPLGWNIPYEFNSADWLASCMFVQNHLDALDSKRGISWTTLRYMLGEVQYGGRVTDDYDKRLLNTFARVWFMDRMFDESFEFHSGYNIYKYKNQEEYLDAIDTMNVTDPCEVYGLHSNADITYQTFIAKEILDTIVSVQPKGTKVIRYVLSITLH